MKSSNNTIVGELKWGWHGFALELAVFCGLEGIGVGFYLLNTDPYQTIAKGFMLGAWIAVAVLRVYRSLPLATAEIARRRATIQVAQAQGRRDASQPFTPPTRAQWMIGLVGVTILLIVGFLINYGQPPIRIQCDRVQTRRVDCQVQSLMFWLIPVGVQTVQDVQTVTADSDSRSVRSESLGESGKTYSERDISLTFTNGDQVQTIIELDGALWGSFTATAQRINRLIVSLKSANIESDSIEEERIVAWHTPSLPTLVSVSFVFVAGLVYFSGFMQLIKNQRAVTKRRHQ
ncbi:hypothetical protein BH10CHL1_BH10CHL1_09290 [soil metagenome]